MARLHTYTPEQRAEALTIYAEQGPAAAQLATGIPRKTISSWARLDGLQADVAPKRKAAVEAAQVTYAQRRLALREIVLDGAYNAARNLASAEKGYSARDWAVATGIAIDKLRLEEGEVTVRTETRTDDPLSRELEQLARGRAAGPTEARTMDRPSTV